MDARAHGPQTCPRTASRACRCQASLQVKEEELVQEEAEPPEGAELRQAAGLCRGRLSGTARRTASGRRCSCCSRMISSTGLSSSWSRFHGASGRNFPRKLLRNPPWRRTGPTRSAQGCGPSAHALQGSSVTVTRWSLRVRLPWRRQDAVPAHRDTATLLELRVGLLHSVHGPNVQLAPPGVGLVRAQDAVESPRPHVARAGSRGGSSGP